MIKKITTPSNNKSGCVELILIGAKKRRSLAYANANMINSDAGIKANLRAVKQPIEHKKDKKREYINKAGHKTGIFID